MDQQLFPTAIRDVRTALTQQNTLVAMGAIGIVLGLSGPFDTLRLLSIGPRVMYWLIVVVTTYAVGSFVSTLCDMLFRGKPIWVRFGISTILIGVCVTCTLTILNKLAFDIYPADRTAFFAQLGIVTLISGVIEVGSRLIRPASHTALPPPLLERMPFATRGELIALNSEDHYVKVTTTQGNEMLLMRLSDAIKEVGDTRGLQIHRSHWIALDHITDVRRVNDRGEVTLTNNEVRPISRGYMPAVRDAGLLPRSRNG